MDQDIRKFEQDLDVVISNLKNELAGLRASRATTKLVEDIRVDYYNQQMTIKQLGNINIVPPRQLEIVLWDKAAIQPIVKAIEILNLGLGISVDGHTIRLSLPALTQERRDELSKLVKKISEERKISIRKARDEINKKINEEFKAKIVSENQKFIYLKKIDEITKKHNEAIDQVLSTKIKEINE